MQEQMKAAILTENKKVLELTKIPKPTPTDNQLLLKVRACAICRTDLHVIDGELSNPKRNLILGHEIVGTVVETGSGVSNFKIGDLVGVPWLASTCLNCSFCLRGQENLCPDALFTGYTVDGGFSEYTVADSRFCFPIPENYDAPHAAPLLCAGLIGWRSLKFVDDEQNLGIYGFGAAAHVITPIAIHQGKRVFAFTSPGDERKQKFALSLGVAWSGSSLEKPPAPLDAAIIFASAGSLIPKALSDTRPGGTVVCGGIHMSDIPSFPYSLLWGERSVKSVANLCRKDGEEFFNIVKDLTIQTHVSVFDLEKINDAIEKLRHGAIEGAAVIVFNQ